MHFCIGFRACLLPDRLINFDACLRDRYRDPPSECRFDYTFPLASYQIGTIFSLLCDKVSSPGTHWCTKCQELLFNQTFYDRLLLFENTAEDIKLATAFQPGIAAKVNRTFPLLVDMFIDASSNVSTTGRGHRHSDLSSCFSRVLLTRSGKLDVGIFQYNLL
jgi:hypothetical protein